MGEGDPKWVVRLTGYTERRSWVLVEQVAFGSTLLAAWPTVESLSNKAFLCVSSVEPEQFPALAVFSSEADAAKVGVKLRQPKQTIEILSYSIISPDYPTKVFLPFDMTDVFSGSADLKYDE